MATFVVKKSNFKKIATSCGVYQFIDKKNQVLYLGKAKNLRNRVKSYFSKDIGRGPAIEDMVRESRKIRTIETESEIEAVLLEAELIKKIWPKYNIQRIRVCISGL